MRNHDNLLVGTRKVFQHGVFKVRGTEGEYQAANITLLNGAICMVHSFFFVGYTKDVQGL